MADAYPWGTQTPQARLSKLERDLSGEESRKTKYLEGHRAKMAEFEKSDREIRADIKVVQAIIERETAEAQSRELMKTIQKLASSGKIDLAALVSNPDGLAAKLAEIGAQASNDDASEASRKGDKGAAAAEAAPAAEAA
ncbi:hypothetical protein [Sphingosinicella sp. BN140058]|uniref:hypothetical protein n=1 Tax=Sphingosinicella sp. BN140058 TaxID=1892855 RepID=UPI00101022F8|nr:hypothetical protein [Sphingosinicella sp. BN140058]QAY80118.1 hypothetical protein ETR14_26105 [Sphingosinicella sp. BN140058]